MCTLLVFLCTLAFGAANRIPNLDGKIVGGTTTNIESYPYQASLLYRGFHFCGASIISQRYVVTAAHCTNEKTASTLRVRVGSSIRNVGFKIILVSHIAQHPDFNIDELDSDVSVLRLAITLIFGPTIQPIRIQSEREPEDGATAVVTGWGTLRENGTSATFLQTVTIKIISRTICRNSYGESEITDNMICAGSMEGGKDSCQGDSGGPLVVRGKLAGIVSWGYGCARPNYPGIYTNVAKIRQYIIEKSDISDE